MLKYSWLQNEFMWCDFCRLRCFFICSNFITQTNVLLLFLCPFYLENPIYGYNLLSLIHGMPSLTHINFYPVLLRTFIRTWQLYNFPDKQTVTQTFLWLLFFVYFILFNFRRSCFHVALNSHVICFFFLMIDEKVSYVTLVFQFPPLLTSTYATKYSSILCPWQSLSYKRMNSVDTRYTKWRQSGKNT